MSIALSSEIRTNNVGVPEDLEVDDLFNTLPPASRERVGALLADYVEYLEDTFTDEEFQAYTEIKERRDEARYAQEQRVPQEVIDALLIARARGEPGPTEGPRLQKTGFTTVLLEDETGIPHSESVRRHRVEREERQRLWKERKAKEPAPAPLVQEPEPEEQSGPEPEASPPQGHKGALFSLLMTEPDRSKPCWALRSLGVTKPENTAMTGERQPMRGHKLILEQYEWIAGAWRKTRGVRPVVPTTFNKAIEMADCWYGALSKVGRKRPALNRDNWEKIKPLIETGLSQREICRQTELSRGTVGRIYKLLKETAAQ